MAQTYAQLKREVGGAVEVSNLPNSDFDLKYAIRRDWKMPKQKSRQISSSRWTGRARE